jgi:hypothetical protein
MEATPLLEKQTTADFSRHGRLAIDLYFSKSRIDETSHDSQQRTLAATARAQKRNYSACPNLEIEVGQDRHISTWKTNLDPGATDTWICDDHSICCWW